MIRPTVRDKLLPDALRQGLLQSVLVFALSAARVGGIYCLLYTSDAADE